MGIIVNCSTRMNATRRRCKTVRVNTAVAALVFALLSVAVPGRASADAGTETRELEGTITLSGAWALYPMAVRWAEEFRAEHPSVRIDIAAGGAGKGMADCLAGAVDLGMISRDIYPAEVERGAWWVSVTKDAVVPVVSSENPDIERLMARGLPQSALKRVWTAEDPGSWGDITGSDVRAPIRVYTRSDACGAAKTWAKYIECTQEDLLGVGVYGDPGLAETVKRDPLGIGYNNINYVYDSRTKAPVDGLTVLPIDLDGDGLLGEDEIFYGDRDALVAAISRGDYPSPPARDLHLAACGRPDNRVVLELLRWILTDGQQYVPESGYISLPVERLEEELGRLED